MGVSAIAGAPSTSSSGSAQSYGVSSLQSQVTKLDAKIFDISTCTTTDAKTKASTLSNLGSQKAALETQIQRMQQQAKKSAEDAKAFTPHVREGSTIHVIA